MTIDQQIVETLRARKIDKRESHERALAVLASVQVNQPERVFNLYPYEVSGGMGRRVMIAMTKPYDFWGSPSEALRTGKRKTKQKTVTTF